MVTRDNNQTAALSHWIWAIVNDEACANLFPDNETSDDASGKI